MNISKRNFYVSNIYKLKNTHGVGVTINTWLTYQLYMLFKKTQVIQVKKNMYTHISLMTSYQHMCAACHYPASTCKVSMWLKLRFK